MTRGAGARDLAATVGADILAGRWGDALRQAQADRDVVAALRGSRDPLTTLDVPDLLPTADELLERVVALAPTLHQLDNALSPRMIAVVDQRIAAARDEPPSDARERRLALLEHQRVTIRDLDERRALLVKKVEAALLALARLRYEAKRLRGR
ncbi:MAG: hypothetical protein HOQ11_08330 [Gemmatimonadaceae bacterium]|nr:hypothetical protein [Gemmatimonadaceae bacterium]NUQ91803.1 hypothetical protein [Gemmatimonadaceae bacterium]NUR19065.1 hypothetical protein [Gemmatimonadaceae bacterium]NUS97400.1 hypothetical protein [Gemmatimonadaceae bacterium]